MAAAAILQQRTQCGVLVPAKQRTRRMQIEKLAKIAVVVVASRLLFHPLRISPRRAIDILAKIGIALKLKREIPTIATQAYHPLIVLEPLQSLVHKLKKSRCHHIVVLHHDVAVVLLHNLCFQRSAVALVARCPDAVIMVTLDEVEVLKSMLTPPLQTAKIGAILPPAVFVFLTVLLRRIVQRHKDIGIFRPRAAGQRLKTPPKMVVSVECRYQNRRINHRGEKSIKNDIILFPINAGQPPVCHISANSWLPPAPMYADSPDATRYSIVLPA